MQTEAFADIPKSIRERLAFIDFRLYFLGQLNRADLIDRFGISASAASRALALYRNHAADNITYSQQSECYQPTESFAPLFHYSSSQVLTSLTEGLGSDLIADATAWLPSELTSRLAIPSIETLAPVSRALFLGSAIGAVYFSLNSGRSAKTLIPLALIDTGQRWHLRAYDIERVRYADFVLNRFESVHEMNSPIDVAALRQKDADWHTQVDLELTPHPAIKHPEVIAFEYGMADGILPLRVRAALAGYLLRRWNVDCTTDHSLRGPEYHLWLRNSDTLRRMTDYPVPNMTLAPGFVPPVSAATQSAHPRGTV